MQHRKSQRHVNAAAARWRNAEARAQAERDAGIPDRTVEDCRHPGADGEAVKRIPLPDWALLHYSPPPSLWVLRQWARQGEIYPSPERVGRSWYVREDARRQTEARPSLVSRL